MPYELAQQMKDAGFPQKYTVCKHGCPSYILCEGGCKLEDKLYWPKLEELIEACEEKGQLLLGCYGKGKYTARVGYFIESTPEQEAAGYPQISAHIAVESPTLIEAVAHLWLALNSPNQETK